jgi:hypothetical protein
MPATTTKCTKASRGKGIITLRLNVMIYFTAAMHRITAFQSFRRYACNATRRRNHGQVFSALYEHIRHHLYSIILSIAWLIATPRNRSRIVLSLHSYFGAPLTVGDHNGQVCARKICQLLNTGEQRQEGARILTSKFLIRSTLLSGYLFQAFGVSRLGPIPQSI